MKYAFYPGCSMESIAADYALSVEAVCKALGVELEELDDWNCCGASSGHCTNYRLSHALTGRNLAIAEKMGMDTAVACPACFVRLKSTIHEAREDDKLRKDIAEVIGQPYEAKYDVKNLVDIIVNDVGIDEIRKTVKKPLTGLKVVSYYGCFLVRPPKIVQFDDPENPQSLDILMDALGAEVLDWSGKVDCCGGSLALTKQDIVRKLVSDIVDEARQVGAEAIVAACSLCIANLEGRQTVSPAMPVLYFTELMGLAFGMPEKEVRGWLKKRMVNPVPLLQSHNLL